MILVQAEGSLVVKVLDMSMFNFVQMMTFAFKMWLFYGKGCLILTYYYLNGIGSRMFNNSQLSHLDYLEIRFIDPLVNLLLLNSAIVSKFNGLLLTVSGTNNIINSIILSFQSFNFELYTLSNKHKLRSPYFLAYSLDYFCSIDNQTIYKNYKLTNKFLNFFSLSSVSRFDSSPDVGSTPLFNRKVRLQPHSVPQGYHEVSQIPYEQVPRSRQPSPRYSPQSLSPRMSPRQDIKDSRIISDKIELLERDRRERIENHENLEPRSFSDSVVQEKRSRANSRSDPVAQLNVPPNAISIDQVLNNRNLNHKPSAGSISGRSISSRSRASSINELPYPIDL